MRILFGLIAVGALAAMPAEAHWTNAPTKSTMTETNGVKVYRGAAPAPDLTLAGGKNEAGLRQTLKIDIDTNCRYPARHLTHHGFTSGERRYHQSHGAFPGSLFRSNVSYPGRYYQSR